MSEIHPAPAPARGNRDGFVRFGGIAMLCGFLIHIYVNMVLKVFPPEDPTREELKAYLSAQAGNWAVVHGLRYVAFSCIAVFAAAIFVRTCRSRDSRALGWAVLGLLGAALHVTSGILTNGIEVLAFLDFDRLSGDPKLFWLVFHLTRVLFTGEIVAWGLVIGGFSTAGILATTLPRWLAVLGIVDAIGCLACGVFLVSILNDGRATFLVELVPLGCLAWFLAAGALLAFRGAATEDRRVGE